MMKQHKGQPEVIVAVFIYKQMNTLTTRDDTSEFTTYGVSASCRISFEFVERRQDSKDDTCALGIPPPSGKRNSSYGNNPRELIFGSLRIRIRRGGVKPYRVGGPALSRHNYIVTHVIEHEDELLEVKYPGKKHRKSRADMRGIALCIVLERYLQVPRKVC